MSCSSGLANCSGPQPEVFRGTHGIQIHEVGRCDPPTFASAGGIFNPFGKPHGLLNPGGPTAGDVPNLVIGSAGVGAYNTTAPLVKLTTGPAAVLRPGGTSLVILERIDTDLTQPEGNAGARIACGVIVASGNSASGLLSSMLIGGLGIVLIGAGLLLRSPRR